MSSILGPVITFLADYLKNKPFTDVLLVIGIGVFLWMDWGHRETAKDAHAMVRQVLHERDEREDERTDKVIAALTGVKNEVKRTTAEVAKIPEATAKAAADVSK